MTRSFHGAAALLLVLACSSLILGCGGGDVDDPILRLSSEEAFAKGNELMAAEKYELAREHFAHAFQTAPNSSIGRDALLLQADAYFLADGETNLIRAESKYRDFNNRYPTSDRGAYVQHQVALSLEKRMRKADRDQSETEKAIAAYEELVTLYPTSEYAEQADEGIARLKVNLAEHEFLVAKYQFRRGLHQAAVNRLDYLMENYPEYQPLDKVLCIKARSHHKLKEDEEATTTFARLRADYPTSPECKGAKGAAS